MTGVPVHTR